MCLAGAVVASWSLAEEVAGLTVMTNYFVSEFAGFGEIFRKNSTACDNRAYSIIAKTHSFW